MLPAPNRMRRSSDFGATVCSGRRAGTGTVVVHVLTADVPQPPVVGFVVSKGVGGAVVRNRTKRRLRALMRPVVPVLSSGSRVVVRAQPAAAGATTARLGRELTSALRRAGVPAPGVTGRSVPAAAAREGSR